MIAERREVVPVGMEIRVLAWIGVMLIATGVGIFVGRHLEDIGPLAIAIALAVLALACYVWVDLKSRAPLDDYVVLLGALLLSADAAFIENRWHLLGSEWQRHFLLLAIAHAAAAYWFNSRAVLSLSITSLAAWIGVERKDLFSSEVQFAVRAFVCAGVVAAWRFLNQRAEFAAVFDQFAINLAFWGALALTANRDFKLLGLLVTVVLGAAALWWGFRERRELFVMYAFIYTIIAINIVIAEALAALVSAVGAIVGLFVIHARFRKRVAEA